MENSNESGDVMNNYRTSVSDASYMRIDGAIPRAGGDTLISTYQLDILFRVFFLLIGVLLCFNSYYISKKVDKGGDTLVIVNAICGFVFIIITIYLAYTLIMPYGNYYPGFNPAAT